MLRLAPLILVASLTAPSLLAQTMRHAPDARSTARAESLLAELSQLDRRATLASARSDAARDLAARAAKIYERATALHAGALGIALATSARFYRRAFELMLSAARQPAPTRACERERPGAYRRLCDAAFAEEFTTEAEGDDAAQRSAFALLLAKAQLHASWVSGQVSQARGERSAAIEAALGEMRAERLLDVVLARQALSALENLESVTSAHETLADYEGSGKVGTVSSEEFARKMESAGVVRQSLAWLPEGELKQEIDNAWQSYADGLWWWQRSERTPVVRVSGGSFAENDFAATANLPRTQLGYNAVANWRHARRHTRRVAELIGERLSAAAKE